MAQYDKSDLERRMAGAIEALRGDLVAGSVADLTTPTVAVTGGGIVCVLLVCLLGLRWRGFARYDAHDPQP